MKTYHLGRVGSNYVPSLLSWKSLYVAIDATHQEKEILTSEEILKLERNNLIYVEVKWLRDRAARLTATWNWKNAPCEQLRSMKAPHCAWSIRGDVGQSLRMYQTFPWSCYGAFPASWQVLKSTWS